MGCPFSSAQRGLLKFFALSVCCALAACAALAPKPATVDSRVQAQNALFEEYYQADLKRHPERATAYGDYRYNDRLDDYSLAAVAAEHASDRKFLARLMAISTDGLPEPDLISHQALLRVLQQHDADYQFKEYEMPVSQMSGPHVHLADLALAVPLNSVKQYQDYLARLHQIPRVFAQTEEVLRAGRRDHLMPVRFLLEKVPAQCQGIIASDPFLGPTSRYPADMPADQQQRLTAAITAAVDNEVLPAYRSFAEFITTQYAPHGREQLAVTSLPGGAARYLNNIHSRTTVTDMTPEQIHRLGLHEVERIEAQMLVIARHEGFSDLASYRESLKTNPKYIPTSAEQILNDYRKDIGQMEPRLPQLFGFVPNAAVTVEAIPPFQSAMATHYQTGTPDGSRPGRVVVATSNFARRSTIGDESTAYHEAIPGHHLQLSVAQLLTGLPKFRQHGGNSGYIEGWALYAEQLGKEIGFYQEPASDYGRLTSELFRAERLVVDTGLHSMGWTRDQMVEQLRQSGSIDEPTIQSEVDRYIAWPGQALAYKLGQLKILALRERARNELGAKFDIRSFDDEILNGGALPLDLLATRTDRWIDSQKARLAWAH
ncbi:MAG TPA: DUF885 domain-containing protein [Steroidobacteraceae bacterium]|jgi:uncharacterized protein (DUF885 family)